MPAEHYKARSANSDRLNVKPLSTGKKLTFLAIPFLVFVLLVELFFRVLGYGALRDNRYMDDQPPNLYYWVVDSKVGFRNRAHGRYIFTGVEGRPVSTTDEKGYRVGAGWDRRFEHPPEVALLGDSMIFGVELNDDQTIASELYRQLGSRAPVVNSGVRGYSTIQEKRLLPQVLADFPSVRVVLYIYVDNDRPGNFIEATDPAVPVPLLKYEGPDAPFREMEPQISPAAVGKPFDRSKFAQRSGLQAAVRNLVIWSHSAAVNRLIRIAQQRFSASGSEAVPPAGTEYNDQIGDNGMRQLLREMKAICDRNQVRFLAVRASEGSSAGDIALEGSFLANCRGAGVKAIPAADQFNGNPRRYMTVFENHSGYDFHYGPGGAAKLAEVVAPAIQKALSAPSVE